MDVQATLDAPSLPPLTINSLPPLPPIGGPSDNGGSTANTGSAPQTGSPVPGLIPSLPPQESGAAGELTKTVAKLFNTAAENVAVSFQVAQGTQGEVVVVFSDKTSGKTIVQFPSETLIAMAQFFNKLAGVVLDKKA